jgi:hypothetical protein
MIAEHKRMNITHRGLTYTVRTEGEAILLCWLLAQLEPLAVDRYAV